MISALFKKDKLISFIIWSFFSFSLVQLLSIFIYSLNNNSAFALVTISLSTILSFAYFFINAARFKFRLSYPQYLIYNFLFSLLVTIFSYGYFCIVMLNNEVFPYQRFLALAIVNLLCGSLLFLFTLIKKP